MVRRNVPVKSKNARRLTRLRFSTHYGDAAIMLRLIFQNVLGMILTTGNVNLIQRTSRFCEATVIGFRS